MSEIRVTCHAADVLPIDSLVELQGGLKKISRDNLDKLKRSILRHGFSAPIFVWRGTDNHILDGHARLKALIEFRQEGYDIPLLPVAYVDADNIDHAKEKLLFITSQYGDFTTEGFAAFAEGLDFSVEDIRLTDGEFWTGGDVNFDPATEDEQGRLDELSPKMVTCPHCGQEYDLREQG